MLRPKPDWHAGLSLLLTLFCFPHPCSGIEPAFSHVCQNLELRAKGAIPMWNANRPWVPASIPGVNKKHTWRVALKLPQTWLPFLICCFCLGSPLFSTSQANNSVLLGPNSSQEKWVGTCQVRYLLLVPFNKNIFMPLLLRRTHPCGYG